MSTGHVDATIKTAVLANTVFDAVLDASAINAYYTDIGNKIDGNYDEAHANNVAAIGLYRKGSINGGMQVAQRGTSFTIASGASAYTVDRIKSVNLGSGQNANAAQLATTIIDGINKYLQMIHAASPSAQGKLSYVYTMEAQDSYKLAGQQITFQVMVLGVGSMNRVTLNARYKTSESAISNSSILIASSGLQVITGGWSLVTLTVTLPTRSTLTTTGVVGIEIVASSTIAELLGDGLGITALDWNLGSTALPFQPRSFVEELALCQRYYEKSYSYATAPATASTLPGIIGIYVGASVANNNLYGRVKFSVKKRAVPTMTIYPYTTPSNTGRVSDAGSTTDFAATSGATNFIGDDGFSLLNGSGGAITLSSGNAILFHYAADSEL